jgi:hypothetical protein
MSKNLRRIIMDIKDDVCQCRDDVASLVAAIIVVSGVLGLLWLIVDLIR